MARYSDLPTVPQQPSGNQGLRTLHTEPGLSIARRDLPQITVSHRPYGVGVTPRAGSKTSPKDKEATMLRLKYLIGRGFGRRMFTMSVKTNGSYKLIRVEYLR